MDIDEDDLVIYNSIVPINTKKKPRKRKSTSLLPSQKRVCLVEETLEENKIYMFNRSDGLAKDEVALQNKFNAKVKTDYICNFCEKPFFNQMKLKLHMLLYHDVKYCEICNVFLLDEEDARRHHDKVHAVCMCQICQQNVIDDLEEHYLQQHDAKLCKYCQRVMRPSSYYETHLQEKHNISKDGLTSLHEEDIIGTSKGCLYYCNLCGTDRNSTFFGHFCFHHKISFYALFTIMKRLGIEIKQLNAIKTDAMEIIKRNDRFCDFCPKTVPRTFHKVFCENHLPCKSCFEIFENADQLAEHEKELCISREEDKCGLCKETLTEDHLLIKHKTSIFEDKLINYIYKSLYCALCDDLLNDEELYKHFKEHHTIDDECILINIGSRNFDEDNDELNSAEEEEKMLIFEDSDYRSDFDPKYVKFCFDETTINAENLATCDYCDEGCDDNIRLLEHLNGKHLFQVGCYIKDCKGCLTTGKHLKRHLNYYEEFRTQPHECKFCSKSLFTSEARNHFLENHIDFLGDLELKRFGVKCRFCEEIFWETELKEQHELLQHLDGNNKDFFKCSKCETTFCSLDSLRKHVDCETYADLVYQCRICHLVYANISKVREHFNDVHSDMLLIYCPFPECGRTYAGRPYLKMHVRQLHMTKKGIHECNICGRKLLTETALRLHTKSHDRGYKCTVCRKKFNTDESRNFHYSNEHSGQSVFECSICQKTYQSRSALFVHRRMHMLDNKKVPCKVCNKEFDIVYMREHMLIHNGPRLKCPHCPKTSTSKSNLRRHIRIHTGEKPFTCPYCPKTFTDKGACNAHANIHTGQLSCHCEICGKKFSKRQKLNNHMKRHTGDGLQKCEVCGREYACTTEFRKHMSLQHKELQVPSTQYVCHCGRYFTAERFLKLHMSKVHDPVKELESNELNKIKSFQCLLCQNDFTYKKTLERHLKTIHQLDSSDYPENMRKLNAADADILKVQTPDTIEKDVKKLQDRIAQFVCLCGRYFTAERFLKLHMSKVHDPTKELKNKQEPNKINSFQCLLCQNYYTTKQTIERHLKTIHQLKSNDYPANMRKLNATKADILKIQTPDTFEEDAKTEEISKTEVDDVKEEEIPESDVTKKIPETSEDSKKIPKVEQEHTGRTKKAERAF